MSQVSRPFQIALVAMVLLVMVWFVALRGHGSPTEPAHAPGSSSTSTVYKGSAPGVAGLTGAVAKAHGAVKTSEQNVKVEQSKSAKLSGEAAPSTTASTAAGAVHAPTPASKTGSASKSSSKAPTKSAAGAGAKSASKQRQAAIAHELSSGKVVLLMFWNPKSSDDQSVRAALHEVSRRDGRVAVHVALPMEVGQFGGYTRGVQILQTPTVLVIDSKGQATTLTGLNDARTIQQAIGDALRGGAGKVQTPTLTAWVHGSSRSAYIGRANGLCKKPITSIFGEGTVRSALTSFHSYLVTIVNPFLGKIAALSPPAADRSHVDRLLALFRRAGGNVDQASTALRSGHGLQARTLVLEAQAKVDQASEGLADYGLTACFPYH